MSSDPINLLRDRIDAVEAAAEDTKHLLRQHVTECYALQKKGMVLNGVILVWMLTHSPEAEHMLDGILKLVKLLGIR